MIDANSQFFAILTNVGMAKQANADALGIPWKLTEMGVGDANPNGLADPPNPIPSADQTKLINEWRRKPLNKLKIDPVNPAVIIAEQIIPADEGGKWLREIGLYDADGDLVAVANCAPSFKPLLSQGSGRTQVVRMNFVVSNTGNITLKIDPSVVLATREYVDAKILEELYKLDSKQSVRVATTANIALTGLQSIDGVALAAGDRVLVKNQNAAKDNGIWVAAAAGWSRAVDADSSTEVTSALLVSVEQGAMLADTRWQLITDGVIVLGTTALTFQNVTQGFAPINSPALVNPTANTPAQFDASQKLATTEFAQRAQGNFVGRVDIAALPATLSAAAAGHRIVLAASGTLTLPPVNSVPTGANFFLFNTTPGVVNLVRQGADVISAMSVNSLTSIPLQSLSTIQITAGNGQWVVESGMSALKYAPEFGSFLGANGYQRLPSGLIEQWGAVSVQDNTEQTVLLSTAFPNAILGALASVPNAGSAGPGEFSTAGARKNGSSLNSILVNSNSGPTVSVMPVVFWRAWGY
ncbi:phage tail protein [Pseudomonas fluorescens]|uniref:Phage tail protein n=1 Tax=Pseudomonas fluorescens TaxID=294 RepID=A0A5E6QHM8_PSEFL|nr:phage tail protein [Pseudomonas fluorescens]VVM54808.1 hypothetical protein PS655_00979 [Pseudomonas fluorescens]